MSRVEDAVQCFCGGAACSQAIVAQYGPLVGLPAEQGIKLASGFAGGMRLAQTCGAVTGAFMVLGLKYAGPNCDQRDGRERVYAAIREFAARFQQRNHTVVCKELLGCDISTPQGAQRATQEGLFRTICPKLVQDAAEILEEML
ncbi:MAG TPA: C-GCAxxG-C-C family protein [Sedimentisphaerales bacterium]|jgi:C_GCAxxG_C_C family probable redox protein|nr:C-GCAxxG-C-C family protein [Sedimentisphaerales bacterium]HNU30242.1 C-GCAxxG-C-C family protein [Sedimentisphaerales bacterium]